MAAADVAAGDGGKNAPYSQSVAAGPPSGDALGARCLHYLQS